MNVQLVIIPFEEELLPVRKLTTGNLSCIYEHGSLRYLKCGETELIRMIYFAVRDKDWKTAEYTIQNESIQTFEGGFLISYSAFHHLDKIDYRTDVTIKAENQVISFDVKGEALSSFKRNRIGICVLHPIKEYRGKAVRIERRDGTKYHSKFPDLISPHQPFKEIYKMHCQISESIKTDLIFEGDVFETEDQRNWTDSTYKTYSTPVNIPFPVDVSKGEIVEQRLELRVAGEKPENKNETTTIERKIAFPKIGYEANNDEPLSETEIDSLKQIPFDHYRAEISLFYPGWHKNLHERFEETRKLNTKLELILSFNEDYKIQIEDFAKEIKEMSSYIDSLLILQMHHASTPAGLMEAVYTEIKKSFPHILIGYGTNGFFADLNRNRPTGDHFDFVSFSLSPQVHASDTRTLTENLERQSDLIEVVRTFAPGKVIHISPITFKIRSSPGKVTTLPADYDARQHRSFGAMWTLLSLKNLAEADRLTFYQVKGYRGILQTRDQSPLYKMLKAIKTFNPRWIVINDHDQNILPGKVVLENNEGRKLEFTITPEHIFHH